MIWSYPIITALRKRIRTRTLGKLPPMTTQHPVIGLIHDIQRLVRRRVLGGRHIGV